MSKQPTRHSSRKGAGSSSSSSSFPAAVIRSSNSEEYENVMHGQQEEAEIDTRKRKAASSSSSSSSTSNKKRTKLKNEVEVAILVSSSSSSSSAVAPMQPAAQSSSPSRHTNFPLYNDVLGQVIKYMNIHELHTAVQISKQWHEVVRKTKPLNLVSDAYFMELPDINSALAIHIADAEYLGSKLRNNPSAVYEVALRFPNLTSIGPGLDITTELLQEDTKNGLTLPPLLRSFETRVHIFCLGPLAMALRPLMYLRQLTIGISLFDDGEFRKTSHIDFSCFLPHCWPHLTKFELHFHGCSRSDDSSKPLSDSLVEFIRHCSTLSELNLWTDEELLPRMYDQITEDPSAPLLKSGSLTTVQSSLTYHLSLPLLQSMVKFPSLKILNPGFIKLHAGDMTLLSRFPHLTDLNLSCFSLDSTVEAVIAACKNCPQLRVLQISHSELTTANLRHCLAPLTNLTQLRIVDCPQLKDLAPLLECDLPLRLTELQVSACRLPVSVLTKQIFLLSNLRSLVLKFPFGATKVPKKLKDQMDPASDACVLPQLLEGICPY